MVGGGPPGAGAAPVAVSLTRRGPQLAKLSVDRAAATARQRHQLLQGGPQVVERAPFALEVDVGAEEDQVFGIGEEADPEQGGRLLELPRLAQGVRLHLAGER